MRRLPSASADTTDELAMIYIGERGLRLGRIIRMPAGIRRRRWYDRRSLTGNIGLYVYEATFHHGPAAAGTGRSAWLIVAVVKAIWRTYRR